MKYTIAYNEEMHEVDMDSCEFKALHEVLSRKFIGVSPDKLRDMTCYGIVNRNGSALDRIKQCDNASSILMNLFTWAHTDKAEYYADLCAFLIGEEDMKGTVCESHA